MATKSLPYCIATIGASDRHTMRIINHYKSLSFGELVRGFVATFPYRTKSAWFMTRNELIIELTRIAVYGYGSDE